MTAKELYKELGKIIDQGYGDCTVTTNLEDECSEYGPSYNFISEVDIFFLKHGKAIINLYEH